MVRTLLAASLILLSGCFNVSEENPETSLGDVSIGVQLIDLQRALDEGAINEDEFTELRTNLIAMARGCGNPDDPEADDESGFTWF